MQAETLVDRLVRAGVLSESDHGDIEIADPFEARRQEVHDRLTGLTSAKRDERTRRFAAAVDGTNELDAHVVADAMAIRQFVDGLDRTAAVRAAAALEAVDDPPPMEGVPEGFVRLAAEQIEPFIDRHSPAIVFFWKEDCEACETVRDQFETLRSDGVLDPISLGAVYGPDGVPYIREEFDVAVAPTTLFCVDGRIDSRIIGDHIPQLFRDEVEILTEHGGSAHG